MDSKKILTTALGLPESATDVEIGYALADKTAPATPTTRLTDDPQSTFHSLAERLSKAAGISLADAYSRVSLEAPGFYNSEVRNAADINRL